MLLTFRSYPPMTGRLGATTYVVDGIDIEAADPPGRRIGALACLRHRPRVVAGVGGFAAGEPDSSFG